MTEKPSEGQPLLTIHGEDYKKQMNAFQEGLWEHLEAVPTLEAQTGEAVLRYLLGLACQAQHSANIVLGRRALWGLPRAWVLLHIERCAEPLLELGDEWEYRRLLEVYQQLDADLVHRLALRGLTSPESEIRETAQEWFE